jgi:hypothetical protein
MTINLPRVNHSTCNDDQQLLLVHCVDWMSCAQPWRSSNVQILVLMCWVQMMSMVTFDFVLRWRCVSDGRRIPKNHEKQKKIITKTLLEMFSQTCKSFLTNCVWFEWDETISKYSSYLWIGYKAVANFGTLLFYYSILNF